MSAIPGRLIKGGIVVDGTGAPGRRLDVRLRGGLIVEIGPNLGVDGDCLVDAEGAYVTPGFIDTHTHFDASLFWDPFCDPMPQHGVTTVLMGNCSLSLAPARPPDRMVLADILSYLEDLPKAALEMCVPWDWESFDGYLTSLDVRGGLGLNVACLVGHTALRQYVMGEEAWERVANADEQAAIVAALSTALDAGAFGMSTSMFDEDAAKRPVPSRLADDAELGALLDVLGARRAVLEFIPDVRTRGFKEDVERVAALCGPRGVTATWNGVSCDEARPEVVLGVLSRAQELQQQGIRIYPQFSPRTVDVRINWEGGMSLRNLADGWFRMVQAPRSLKADMLRDPQWRQVAREEWDRVPRAIFRHRELDRLRFVSVARPELEQWVGKTLGDLVAVRGGHASDVLADWVLENDLMPGVVAVGVGNVDPDAVATVMRHPAAIISNSDAGAHLQMMCAAGDTTLLLTKFVRDRGDMTIEEGIHELTGRQADIFGFADRGVIREGAVADVVVFDLDELTWEPDQFVDDLPGGASRLRRPAGNYRCTLVGGIPTQEMGLPSQDRPGRVLRRRADAPSLGVRATPASP